jgi:hypothetical protein
VAPARDGIMGRVVPPPSESTPREYGWRDLRRPLLVVLALAGMWELWISLRFYATPTAFASDAHAYWATGQRDGTLYPIPAGPLEDYLNGYDSFLYSPAFAQVIRPLTWLPWPAFAATWIGIQTGAFLWLFRPLGIAWMLVLTVWCAPEILLGNVHALLAVCLVLALGRYPQAWAGPLLTKPFLGIGLVWHAVRLEWRALAWAVGTTAGIAAVSALLAPGDWSDWLALLRSGAGEPGALFALRIAAAVVVIVVAARRSWAWLVPCALVLATPTIGGFNDLLLVAAIPRLLAIGDTALNDRRASRGSLDG